MKKPSIIHPGTWLALAALFITTFSDAQFSVYPGVPVDRIYQSVATIHRNDRSIRGPGYVIASTAVDNAAGFLPRGEVMRTDASGNPLWTFHYDVNGMTPHRFNHIEKYNFNGTTEYLVIGSVENFGTTTMLLIRLDDNGNVLATREIRSGMFPHLLGTKGIATYDSHFAIVGFETAGFTTSDNKNIVVMKIDSSLNVVYSHNYSTPNTTYDNDYGNSIVEGNPNEYLVVGTCNKNLSLFYPNSYPAAMSSLIDITTGTVLWSYNYSTATGNHWDNASDVLYKDSTFWVLGNSSVIHYFNLTQLDQNGTALQEIQFSDSTYGTEFNYYGYELKNSLISNNNLVIGGWGTIGNSIRTFMTEYNAATGVISWQQHYAGNANKMFAYNENNWLNVGAAGQFPFYYNQVMNYRADRAGYVILGTDSTYSNAEDIQFWWGINILGQGYCGSKPLLGEVIPRARELNDPLFPMGTPFPDNPVNVNGVHVSYQRISCSSDAGRANKAANPTSVEDALLSQPVIYPNPAASLLTVESAVAIREITVIDIALGRKVIVQPVYGEKHVQVDVKGLAPGIYIVQIEDADQRFTQQKVQVIR